MSDLFFLDRPLGPYFEEISINLLIVTNDIIPPLANRSVNNAGIAIQLRTASRTNFGPKGVISPKGETHLFANSINP